MSILANVFIAGRGHRKLLLALLWAALFLALLCVGWSAVRWQIDAYADRSRAFELARVVAMRRNAISSLDELRREAAGMPCSTELLAIMRKIAFIPDGLNVFLHAPNGVVDCTTSVVADFGPVPLGAPDIAGNGQSAARFWVNRDLARLGQPEAKGTIVGLDDFAVVIPPYTGFESHSSWLSEQLVAIGPNGGSWTAFGKAGLYRRFVASEQSSRTSLTKLEGMTCDDLGLYCVVSKANLIPWARDWGIVPLVVVALSALIAWLCATCAVTAMHRYWSFDARFLRNLDRLVLAYQPIIDMRSGWVTACEVLARWRDFDRSIVPPNEFLDIVQRTGRTAEFTRAVVDLACRELSEHVPNNVTLQVNINVFGCDFVSEALIPIFSKFALLRSRFVVAVELVEDQHVKLDEAQKAMLELQRAGLKIYIDDFGKGYSSIERAASLAVDGVKLDRSFAMSRPDSLLGRMFVQVLAMLKLTGRVVVVEGVETHERLQLLRSTGNVDFVQGFIISRPLAIRDFVSFLDKADTLREELGFAA
jgi:sensor c-di-GMP phosphodiesterase-like protein